MKKILLAALLFSSLSVHPVFAIDYDVVRETAADEGYTDKETEIYTEGYEDGYELGYEIAEEKYDKTFFYEYIPGIWMGLLLYSAYQYFTGKDR